MWTNEQNETTVVPVTANLAPGRGFWTNSNLNR